MITDWRAAYDTVPAALAGTDMTTGICGYVFGDGRLLAAVKAGEVPQSLLDDKVRRILRLYLRCGVLDPGSRAKGGLDTPEHRQAARRLAAEGMVLLKNRRQLLPLDAKKLRRILDHRAGRGQCHPGRRLRQRARPPSKSPRCRACETALGGKAQITHLPYRRLAAPGRGQEAASNGNRPLPAQRKAPRRNGPAAPGSAALIPQRWPGARAIGRCGDLRGGGHAGQRRTRPGRHEPARQSG